MYPLRYRGWDAVRGVCLLATTAYLNHPWLILDDQPYCLTSDRPELRQIANAVVSLSK